MKTLNKITNQKIIIYERKTIMTDNNITNERRDKLKKIREKRKVAYPNHFKPQHQSYNLHCLYDQHNKQYFDNINNIIENRISVTVAGRIMLKRNMGKASFITIQDFTLINDSLNNKYNAKHRIQIYITANDITLPIYEEFKHYDLGDIVGIAGYLFKTKTDELTIHANKIILISKNIQPLPEKFHGLHDVETKYRKRYIDLIMNQDSKQRFIDRTNIIQSLRNTLIDKNFLEVETPMMQSIPGGANAKPFITHHNALDMNLFMRIAPELYLKRLLVGGLDRVFEINRNFRNEGVSARHNPEFTMLELYQAYANYQDMMNICEQLIKNAAIEIGAKSLQIEYQGLLIDLNNNFDRITMVEAIHKYNPEYSYSRLNDINWLKMELKNLQGNEVKNSDCLSVLQLMLFEATTEEKLIQPSFIIDYPTAISPLARSCNDDPEITERFELFCCGKEIANGYSELNDPEDQADRFKLQANQKDAGNEEAMYYDDDYIFALEVGMPPAGGLGIGVDRLVMLLTDAASIRDVILFPLLKKH